jgi:hypothetical protein
MLPTGQESQRGLPDFAILWAYARHRSHKLQSEEFFNAV